MGRARRTAVVIGGLGFAACGLETGGIGAPPAIDVTEAGPMAPASAAPDAAIVDARAEAEAMLFEAGPNDATPDAPDAHDANIATCPYKLSDTVTATVRVTVDNYRRLSVNGILVDSTAYEWTQPTAYTITLNRHPSRMNVVAIQGDNVSTLTGFDRGILAEIDFIAPDATTQKLVTDSTWRVSTTAQTGWTDLTFIDTAWSNATVEGAVGMQPWGPIAGFDPSARWIWSYYSDRPAGQKVTNETTFTRRNFYLDVNGRFSSTSTACP